MKIARRVKGTMRLISERGKRPNKLCLQRWNTSHRGGEEVMEGGTEVGKGQHQVREEKRKGD